MVPIKIPLKFESFLTKFIFTVFSSFPLLTSKYDSMIITMNGKDLFQVFLSRKLYLIIIIIM